MPALIAYVDNEQKYVFCNAEHHKWFGISPKKVPGMAASDIFDEHITRILQPYIDKVLEGEQVSFEIQLSHRLKGPRICDMTLIPHTVEDRTIAGFCVLATDITETKRAEAQEEEKNQQLIRALKKVKASNRELEQFASVCSHDIQEPLRMVRAYVELLDKQYSDKFDEKAHTYFRYIAKGAHRMQLMVDSLLDYARLTTPNMAQTNVKMEAVLQQALNNLEPLIQKNDAKITAEALPEISGHPIHLLRLMQNLLSNAIKFRGKEPPSVHICAERLTGEWLFSIRDNGIGIDSRRHGDIIFDLFQRIDPSEERSGTGIGLSLCKKIVENHDGKLWYQSKAGKGTTFFFTLPA
jgi:PAS domain S-box-containing protein